MTAVMLTFETIPEDHSVPDLPKEVNGHCGNTTPVMLPPINSTLNELRACLMPLRQAYDKYKRQALLHKLGTIKRQTLDKRAEEMQQSLATMRSQKVFANFSVILGKTDDGKRTRVLASGSEEAAVINAASLSYLALEREPAVIQSVKTALDLYGTTMSSSRAFCGSCPLHVQVNNIAA